MDKIDEMIGQALTDEDRALLARHGEPGYLHQAFGVFRGPMAWAMWVAYVAGGVAFVAAAYGLWQMAASGDVLAALKWGVGSLLLFQISVLTKGFLGNQMQANRMLRELKRLELQVSLLRDERRG
ncbi:MAG: hypothetical protein M3Q40_05080 [Pseudomonadota bacterium]|nr:hypothetical protein [Pseudomonadota bacterium]